MKGTCIKVFLLLLLVGCKKEEIPPATSGSMYFPPTGSDTWETTTPESLGWNTAAIPALYDFLAATNSKAFIVLKDGKIVLEKYFGTQVSGAPFDASSLWYWASAGKTLTASLVGIAQQQGFLKIENPSSNYLGTGWSSLTPLQESQITVRNHITMTTGLDDGLADPDCTTKPCLQFKAAAGTRWAYHNAAYTILDRIIAGATGQSFDGYFNAQLRDKIGMNGAWVKVDYNNIYFSSPRSMARYGLLILNNGKWKDDLIIKDAAYMNAMVNTSQNLNLSYGYLWWLNGKASFMVPGFQTVFPSSLSPAAPAEMVAAMGKNGQLINVVPSQKIVMIRMGEDPASSLVPFTYQNDIWNKLKLVIK